jgi:lipopolysaccharide/colanic/teichoic acid biosynthesis glycosyltransferase
MSVAQVQATERRRFLRPENEVPQSIELASAIGIHEFPPSYRIAKRIFDVGASLTGVLLLFPALLVTAVLVRLSSPGPILFRQERVGLGGKTFVMYKFRTMVVDAESLRSRLLDQNEQSSPVFKIRNDPRITRIGRLLRRYSIDELPQLFNVIRGDIPKVS